MGSFFEAKLHVRKKSGAINCRIFAFISRKQYVTSMWSSVRNDVKILKLQEFESFLKKMEERVD